MSPFLDQEVPDEGDDETGYSWDCDLVYPIENSDEKD